MPTQANALNISSAGLVKFDGTATFTGVTTTQHDVLVGAASNGITSITAGTNGQALLGSTGADPAFATLTSTGGSLTYTTGAASLNIDIANFAQTTFTPVLSGTGTAGSPTYTAQIGQYMRIGTFVFIYIALIWTASGGATGNWQITGLPFTSHNTAHQNTGFTTLWGYDTAALASGAGSIPVAELSPNSSTISLFTYSETTGASTALAVTAIGSLLIQGFYIV